MRNVVIDCPRLSNVAAPKTSGRDDAQTQAPTQTRMARITVD